MTTGGNRGDGWTAVLRRQPARIVDGQPQSGYTNSFEIICPGCGDDPGTDYREISADLRQVCGPYPITDGIAAYESTSGGTSMPGRRTGRGRRLAERR